MSLVTVEDLIKRRINLTDSEATKISKVMGKITVYTHLFNSGAQTSMLQYFLHTLLRKPGGATGVLLLKCCLFSRIFPS